MDDPLFAMMLFVVTFRFNSCYVLLITSDVLLVTCDLLLSTYYDSLVTCYASSVCATCHVYVY